MTKKTICSMNEINKKIYLNAFRKFLMEHKCYKGYIENVESINNSFRIEYKVLSLKYLLNNRGAKSWISYGFNWDETKQGFRFWEDLDYKWTKMVEKKNF